MMPKTDLIGQLGWVGLQRRGNPSMISFGTAAEDQNGEVIVPIELRSASDIAAVGFSFTFDPVRFANPRVVVSNRLADDAVVTLNRSAEGIGMLGVLIDSESLLTDAQDLGFVLFKRIDRTFAPTIEVSDSPVSFSASDRMGNSLPLEPIIRVGPNSGGSVLDRLFAYLRRRSPKKV